MALGFRRPWFRVLGLRGHGLWLQGFGGLGSGFYFFRRSCRMSGGLWSVSWGALKSLNERQCLVFSMRSVRGCVLQNSKARVCRLRQRMFSEARTSSESHLTKSGYQRMLNVYASLLQVWNPASTAFLQPSRVTSKVRRSGKQLKASYQEAPGSARSLKHNPKP